MADIAMIQPHVDSWANFDWQTKLSTVDATVQQAKEAQKQSAQARKSLGESTKHFKRSLKNAEQAASSLGSGLSEETAKATVKSVETLSKECKVTIKSYQEEIDKITRRCKSSESSYASLAQSLMEQSDPAGVMQAMVQQMQDQQTQLSQLLRTVDTVNEELQSQEKTNEIQKREIQQLKANGGGGGGSKEDKEELISLRREVAEYEVEFRNLKNQDITIRKLEAKIEEMQTMGEEAMEEQLEKHKEELEEREGRRVAEALEREAALERKVQTLELQLKAERAGREATQEHLLEADEGVSQREAAWEAQRRILVDDSTRLRESLSTATRERDELRLKVAATEGGTSDSRTPPVSGVNMRDLMAERKAYEAEVAELSETASLLRDELRMKDEQLSEEKKTNQRKIGDLERAIATANDTIEALDSQLAEAPSQSLVDSMRRELRILKRLEYNADDVDTDRDPEIAGGPDEGDLEAVLVSKLRRAETDLVKERISKTDLLKQVDSLKADLADAEKAKEESDKLVFSLEKDLERAIATPVTPSSKPRKVIEMPKDGDPATLQNILDPDAPAPPPPATPSAPTAASEKADDDHSVATIVMAQRDRLRARNEALEAERDSFKRELQIQVQSSESLKADNTKLYEKVRYLQSFSKGPSNRGRADRDLDLEALEQRYEASVDPFRQFSKAERQRKLSEMPPMERAVFAISKMVLATKEMRAALFFYVTALHLLVFSTTYHWSHTDGCHNVNNEHLAFLPHEQQTVKVAEAAAATIVEAAANTKS
eukprot:CAMPEP_0172455078 /NCGR_PEP_ID=MMETSP1065-20121228/11879_1 /TAXON_ID=265537 /ORGANISM="Amphiprora paludosa, Strain CCMP125" /LENGTH=775 /DNA_ID=CAMNT_0013207531 /DNA_START=71 /DNA_END=2398 /DNA_ORIENTATION=+